MYMCGYFQCKISTEINEKYFQVLKNGSKNKAQELLLQQLNAFIFSKIFALQKCIFEINLCNQAYKCHI